MQNHTQLIAEQNGFQSFGGINTVHIMNGVKDDVIVVASFTHRSLEEGYRIGLPREGNWLIRFNSDWKGYSPDFSDDGNLGGMVIAEKEERDGCEFSGAVSLPPYGLIILSQEEAAEKPTETSEEKSSKIS